MCVCKGEGRFTASGRFVQSKQDRMSKVVQVVRCVQAGFVKVFIEEQSNH